MSTPGLPAAAGAALRVCVRAWPLGALGLVALSVLDGLLAPATAWITKLVIDGLTTHTLSRTGMAVLVAALGLTVLVAGSRNAVGQYLEGALRRAVRLSAVHTLFSRVCRYDDLTRFESPAFQDRLSLAQQAGEEAPQEVTRAGTDLLRSAVQGGGFVAALVAVWPPMVPLVLLCAVPAVLLQLSLARERARLSASIVGTVRRQAFHRDLLADPRAAKEVRLFGLAGFLRDRLTDGIQTANAAEDAVDRRSLRARVGLEALAAVLQVVAVAIALREALAGRLSAGDVTVFVTAVATLQSTVAAITQALGDAYRSLLLFRGYVEIVREPLPEPSGAGAAPPLRDAVRLEDVWFRYGEDGPWVLRGVNLTVPAGRSVGLVGHNGAGKSTIAKLVCGLYRPTRGRVTWDGVDLRELDPASVRQRISAVFQDYMEYDLTAGENIGMGRLDRLDDEPAVRAAARLVGVDTVVEALPDGYRTLLSRVYFPEERGSPVSLLSGGQWQRLALARAAMRTGADLYLLDEPTSALDPEAEDRIRTALQELRGDRAGLLVSHRLGTIRDADTIVVLQAGTVVQAGRHEELMASGGLYRDLFERQARGYQETGAPA